MSEAYQPVLLRRVGKPNGTSLESYKADGGYNGLKNALAKKPEEVGQVVIDSALRGRGGAGFSTGLKWTFLPKGYVGRSTFASTATRANQAHLTIASSSNRILIRSWKGSSSLATLRKPRPLTSTFGTNTVDVIERFKKPSMRCMPTTYWARIFWVQITRWTSFCIAVHVPISAAKRLA